ncbi:MAG: TolC family protein [Leeuwenhoekiella sp.]
MRYLVTFLFLTFAIQISLAQDQKKWTLEECLDRALKENISIKQSRLDIDAAEIDKLGAIGNFLPSFSANASLSENTGLNFNPITNNAQSTTFLSATGRVNVGYTLFDGLRNFKQVQRAKMAQLSAQYGLEQMEDNIALNVSNSYLQVILNKENLKVFQAQNEVTQAQIKRTQELVDGGVLPQGDVLEIKAQNANEVQSIVEAENNVRISLISLAQILLIKDYKNFEVADPDYGIAGEEILLNSPYEILEKAKEERYEIKIAEQNLKLAEKDVQISRGSLLPTISAFFSYDTRYTDANSFNQIIDPDNPSSTQPIGVVQETGQTVVGDSPNFINQITGPDPFVDQLYINDGIAYGLSVNIPILNGFVNRNQVQRSKITAARAEIDLEQAQLDLESNVYQAYVDAQGSLKSYEAAQVAAESQQLAYDYAKERYDVGLTNSFDLSQSKQRFDNAQIELNRSKYDYIFRLKVLELYFGVPATELKF